MPTFYRRRPWVRKSSSLFFVAETAGSNENVTVDHSALAITPQTIAEAESTLVSHQALTLTGQDVSDLDLELQTIEPAALTITGQDFTEADGHIIGSGALAITGQTVNLIESSATSIEPAALAMTGQDIGLREDDTVTVTGFSLAIAQQDIGSLEYVPVGGVLAGGGGGSGSGPASDAAYYARQKYEQDKRDKETALWKGKPAAPAAEGDGKPAAAPAKKKSAPPPEPFGPDLDALFAELLAPSEFTFTPPPRPARVFDPEDDVAVLLLTDL